MYYHEVKLNLSLTDFDIINIDESRISKFLLLLPELEKEGCISGQKHSSYYVMNSEWNILDDNNKYNYPKSPECKY